MGKHLRLTLGLTLSPDRNAVKIAIARPPGEEEERELADSEVVRLIFRPDIDDRINHAATKAFMGPEKNWPGDLTFLEQGFDFSPAQDRTLKVLSNRGTFTPEPEWTYNVAHEHEEERGLESRSDHFSPGYFSLELSGGQSAVMTAEITTGSETDATSTRDFDVQPRTSMNSHLVEALEASMNAFVVRREGSATVIAGYPWFLDWGRDTLIFLRGLAAAGRGKETLEIVRKFATFEDGGTLPNMLIGEDTTNRSTTDAPLWLFTVCADLRPAMGEEILEYSCGERTLRQVLLSIGEHYSTETKSGAAMDPESGLIWSPTHHTWMDTNHPAGTPREGYPVEIQALWFAALEVLTQIDPDGQWRDLSKKVRNSIGKYFANVQAGHLSDCLHAPKGTVASGATADDACRSNQLLAITLGAVNDHTLCEGILRECRSLLVPGAIRSLADRTVQYPLPVQEDGRLLNDPKRPYWGHYTGPENSRRKPAYHNGTAWAWPMPLFCEALYKVYGDEARKEALALLASTAKLMEEGCLGHVPEVLDGDAPHTQRGCGAQAWSASENLRVWRLLTLSI
jgi:predicted glycogen debranching enzyme